jgi:thiamine-phosphate pyrophosphorylase
MKGYYFITDSSLSKRGNISDVKCALKCGVEFVQYREKNKSTQELLIEAKELRELCKRVNFIVNDRVDIALAVDADGLHLGQGDLDYKSARRLLGKSKIIGVTVHNAKEAVLAQNYGADYLGVSPVFATGTKSDAGQPIGLAGIKEISKKVDIPIVAIGGVTLRNAPSVIAAGADAICAISAVVAKQNVAGQIRKFQSLF